MKRLALLVCALFAALALLTAYVWVNHLAAPGPVEQVRFTAQDGTALVGDLYLPAGEGPYPAMVALLGSGPEVSNDLTYRAHAVAFARRGISVLIYD